MAACASAACWSARGAALGRERRAAGDLGTPAENERFVAALGEVLRGADEQVVLLATASART